MLIALYCLACYSLCGIVYTVIALIANAEFRQEFKSYSVVDDIGIVLQWPLDLYLWVTKWYPDEDEI